MVRCDELQVLAFHKLRPRTVIVQTSPVSVLVVLQVTLQIVVPLSASRCLHVSCD